MWAGNFVKYWNSLASATNCNSLALTWKGHCPESGRQLCKWPIELRRILYLIYVYVCLVRLLWKNYLTLCDQSSCILATGLVRIEAGLQKAATTRSTEFLGGNKVWLPLIRLRQTDMMRHLLTSDRILPRRGPPTKPQKAATLADYCSSTYVVLACTCTRGHIVVAYSSHSNYFDRADPKSEKGQLSHDGVYPC